jgi:hypothetical protein
MLKSIELAGRDGPDLVEATRLILSVSVETGSDIFQPPENYLGIEENMLLPT